MSAEDSELNHIKQCVRTGNWNDCKIPAYLHVKNELCVYGEILLRGTRLVIPQGLRHKVLELAHEGHQGIVKTKYRLRSKVWWPKIDADAEKTCKTCHGCQVVSAYPVPETMTRVIPPSGPWQDCAADLLGPLPSGESLLVIVDYYSRYFEVVTMRSTTSTKLIEATKPVFARFGVPYSLRTDNGPQLVSEEFNTFLKEFGIEHRTTTPLWPQANGEVERQNRTLMKALRIAQVEGLDWRKELTKLLIAHRSTPQVTTGVSPYYLMFGREMRTKLPELQRDASVTDEEVRDRDWSRKLSGKEYVDKKRHADKNPVNVGHKVLVKVEKTNKMSPHYDPNPYEVLSRIGNEVTLKDKDGVELDRNVSFVKKYQEKDVEDDGTCDSGNVEVNHESQQTQAPQTTQEQECIKVTTPVPIQTSKRTRPVRTVKMPKRFDDFVLSEVT